MWSRGGEKTKRGRKDKEGQARRTKLRTEVKLSFDVATVTVTALQQHCIQVLERTSLCLDSTFIGYFMVSAQTV